MENLKNKTRRELIQIINDLKSTGMNNTRRFPNKKEIEDWSYSLWEDKDGMTSGVVDAQNHNQRIAGVEFVFRFMGKQINE